MDLLRMKVYLRYSTIIAGVLFAITVGTQEVVKLLVNRWASQVM